MTKAPVVPVFKLKGFSSNRIANKPKGVDRRDIKKDDRIRQQRDKDKDAIIHNRPFG